MKRLCHRSSHVFVIVLLLATMFSGCARTIYGVSEDRWAHMSEVDRAAARQMHAERQRQLEVERAEYARREAAATEARRREAEAKAQRNSGQVEAIHRGESGVYGDLIRITISGGTMEFYGKRMPYEPITFTLANQERRTVSFRSVGGRSYRTLDVPVSFADGTFTFDVGRQPVRLLQTPQWRRGELHQGLVAGKNSVSDGQGLTLRVEIVPQSGAVVLGSHGVSAGHVPPPPPPPTGGQRFKITRVETQGMYPHDLRLKYPGTQCINMSPFEEHIKANSGLKSFVIEHNGIVAVVETLDAKKRDNARRRSVCRADRSQCQESADWMAVKVNGTAMFLHATEVKRLDFEHGGTLLLSVVVVHERHEREGSALCWN